MNPAPVSIPGFGSLYWLDFTISRATHVAVLSLVSGFGMRWASQPQPNAVIQQPPEMAYLQQWAVPAGLLIAGLALIVLVRRYRWIGKTLSHGTAIQGIVRNVDIYEREAERTSTTTAFDVPKVRTYYAEIGYTWQGVEHRVRPKLPFSPSTYQLAKGREVDLMVLEDTPKRPLIRNVYLGDVRPRKGSWWIF